MSDYTARVEKKIDKMSAQLAMIVILLRQLVEQAAANEARNTTIRNRGDST